MNKSEGSRSTPRRSAFLLLALLLVGCEKLADPIPDQALRREIFFRCMAALPKGPERVSNSNDWDEVVDSCGRQAYFMSLQLKNQPERK